MCNTDWGTWRNVVVSGNTDRGNLGNVVNAKFACCLILIKQYNVCMLIKLSSSCW